MALLGCGLAIPANYISKWDTLVPAIGTLLLYRSPLVGSAHQAFLFSFPAAVKYSTVPTKAGALPTWLTLYSQGPVLSAQNSETRLQTTGPAQS